MKKIIVAIDGHSSCGKSTMAKQLAKKVGYIYVDTGAMYRAVTLFAMQNGIIDNNGNIDVEQLKTAINDINITFKLYSATSLPETFLNDQCVEREIRSIKVSQNVSNIAALGFVREQMVAQQQRMGKDKGIVMDGRDIGTAVFPQAELKIFVTASANVRAQRRYDELKQKGMEADFDEILKNVVERDYIDTHREINPLTQAADALLLDNSNMTIDEQNEWIYKAFLAKVSQ